MRWAGVVALSAAALVLAASLVLYARLAGYALKEIDGDLREKADRAAAALAGARDEAEARRLLSALAGGPGTPLTLGAEAPWRFLAGHMEGRSAEGLGYGFRTCSLSRGAVRVSASLYLKAHERRMRHHQLLILWTTLGSLVAAWGVAWWASGRLFGPLEAAYRRESAFSSDVAHELRTPLTALTGEIEVALNAARSPEEYRAVLSSALEEVRRLTGLVNHLLFLARADAGQERLTLEDVDPAALFLELSEAFGPAAEEKGLRLLASCPDGIKVRADRIRLRQALANLLDNAVRLTAKGEIRLEAERKGNEVMFSVTDTGPGVPEGFRLFERFAKGPGSPGSGLGLSIARWVAEAHGGRAEAESLPGGGARFRISIPL